MGHVHLSPGSRTQLRVAATSDGRIVVLERLPASDQALIDELVARGCVEAAPADPSGPIPTQVAYVVTELGYRVAWS